MPTDSYGQGVSYLGPGDAPNIPLLGSNLANGLAARANLRYASASARNAVLVGGLAPVAGQVTYLAAEDRFEGYTAGQGWIPLTAGPWTPITLAANRTAMYATPEYRINGGNVELRGSVAKTDGTTFYWNGATNEATGLANDWWLGTLPSGAQPTDSDKFVTAATEMATNYYCRIQVRAASASTGPGQIHANIPHIAGQSGTPDTSSGPHWISLDNISFPLV